jgi:hypothetical protein
MDLLYWYFIIRMTNPFAFSKILLKFIYALTIIIYNIFTFLKQMCKFELFLLIILGIESHDLLMLSLMYLFYYL